MLLCAAGPAFGGLHGGAYGPGPKATWDAAYEWYCYSSEKYDEERGE